jgi:hypothetical protein
MSLFKNYIVDFGSISAGSINIATFQYGTLNPSDIVSLTAGCGCSSPVKKQDSVQVTYNSDGHSGSIHKFVTVTLDDKKYPGYNDNGTPKNIVKLELKASIE